ncbi:MAG: protein kinase [Gemmatimonadota bacterium]|nr:MAG: protein kinase [Gemmatimonadota bacterium]
MVSELEKLNDALRDRYHLKQELGRGGMATVYLADDLKHGRQVAIKVIKSDLVASSAADRFLREIKVTARLKHPHILPLLDSGQAGGLPFYVMPYIEGESLKQRLKREVQLPIDDALKIAGEVADALGAAHAHGLVHRDVKPANILLEGGHALVSDFGITRAVDQAGADRLTDSGTAIGTVGYMSPEQATGESQLDGRSDLYSLGCVLYEMLAGETPYTGPSAQAVLARQLNQPVMPVSTVRDTVPEALDRVLKRVLSKVPADRYATAAEFLKALESAAREKPGKRRQKRRLNPRHKTALVLGGVATVAVLAWVSSRIDDIVGTGPRLPPDTSRYVILPFERQQGVSEGLQEVQLLHDALSRWSGLSVADPFQVSYAVGEVDDSVLTPDVAAQVARGLGAGRFFWGEVSPTGDSLRVRAGLYDAIEGALIADQAIRLPSDLGGADSLFTQLADRLLFNGSLPEGTPALSGTRSFPARRAFARGQRSLEAWSLAAADTNFAAARSLDGAYAQAHLWLALVRSWSDADPARWRIEAEQAQLGRERLSDRDRTMADAVLAEAQGDFGQACPLWQALTEREPRDFAAWYGFAHCEASDEVVLRDRRSDSGWRFRSSYHRALLSYQRAFQLLPSILSSFEPGSYASLRNLFMTSGIDLRDGAAVPPDTVTFLALPVWHGDSLTFVPYPSRQALALQTASDPADEEEALRRMRILFRDVAVTWVASAPENASALEVLAIAMSLLGNPSALDTLRRARMLATDPDERLRIAGAEVWMQLAFALPSHQVGLTRARELADSLLRHQPEPGVVDPRLLAGLAALTGRADRAAGYASQPRAADAIRVPPELRESAPALLMYAALGGPNDSLDALELRVRSSIEERLLPVERPLARLQWLARPATLAYPGHSLAALEELEGEGDYVIDLQAAWVRGDSLAVRAGLEEVRDARRQLHPAMLTIDALLPEAELLFAMGNLEGAAAWLDPTLGVLPQIAPDVLASPVRVASLVRAAALRARIAAGLGDNEGARQWTRAVELLWSDADPFLQPIVSELRELGDSR